MILRGGGATVWGGDGKTSFVTGCGGFATAVVVSPTVVV